MKDAFYFTYKIYEVVAIFNVTINTQSEFGNASNIHPPDSR